MKTKIQMRICILGSSLIFSILAAAEPLDWPEPIEVRIGEFIKIKEQAMKFPAMRSKNGILGKRCEKLIDDLGNLITDPGLIQKLETFEGENIKSKIALWAVDRKKRPEEYERFAKYYVNKPMDDEIIEYFSRPLAKQDPDPFAEPRGPSSYIPRPGTWSPNPVDEEDQKEWFRLILEYHYFVPPIGMGFDRDLGIANIGNALTQLKNRSRSIPVFEENCRLEIRSKKSLPPEYEFSPKNGGAFYLLGKIPDANSFNLLSEFFEDEHVRNIIINAFDRFSGNIQSLEMRPDDKADYDMWMNLVKIRPATPKRDKFSKWLLSLDPAKDPSTGK